MTLLVGFIALATALTWILPAGEFERREDAATGRDVVIGTAQVVAYLIVALPLGWVWRERRRSAPSRRCARR